MRKQGSLTGASGGRLRRAQRRPATADQLRQRSTGRGAAQVVGQLKLALLVRVQGAADQQVVLRAVRGDAGPSRKGGGPWTRRRSSAAAIRPAGPGQRARRRAARPPRP